MAPDRFQEVVCQVHRTRIIPVPHLGLVAGALAAPPLGCRVGGCDEKFEVQ